jgi:hypothetical protein
MFFSHSQFPKRLEIQFMKLLTLFICLFIHDCLYGQQRYAVVINEIMADPSPPAGLPNYEWVELLNTSSVTINLRNWRLGDASSQTGPFPDCLLQPDSLLIICAVSAQPLLQAWGRTLAVTSFPSLDNAGELLFLRSADGIIIHALRYETSWYNNALKQEGGWSLEMIDPLNPCSGVTNWKASIHPAGGTPGLPNSVLGINPDIHPPEVLRSYTASSTSLILVFNEPLDSLHATDLSHYSADHGLNFIKAACSPPLFDKVLLETSSYIDSQTVYQVMVRGIKDCQQNEAAGIAIIKAGLATDLEPGKCIINEILFDPRPNAYDYIELYNPGPFILDAARLYIANRNSNGQVNQPVVIHAEPYAIFPGDHIVITENAANLSLHYLVRNPAQVLQVAALPSFPDDKGTVILLNAQGQVVDEVTYSRDWHFKLIDNPQGVSLERIDPQGASPLAGNWHSAASTAGYGTPSYTNSQFKKPGTIQAMFEILPRVFSPDNDGFNDVTTLQYKTQEQGLVANIFIFDAAGRLVNNLVRNSLLGTTGYWNWNGTDNKGQLLPIGIYIIQAELFNLRGEKQQFRNTVVLAKKLN